MRPALPPHCSDLLGPPQDGHSVRGGLVRELRRRLGGRGVQEGAGQQGQWTAGQLESGPGSPDTQHCTTHGGAAVTQVRTGAARTRGLQCRPQGQETAETLVAIPGRPCGRAGCTTPTHTPGTPSRLPADVDRGLLAPEVRGAAIVTVNVCSETESSLSRGCRASGRTAGAQGHQAPGEGPLMRLGPGWRHPCTPASGWRLFQTGV